MTTVDHEPQRDAASDADVRVLAALRAGDETAFMLLVEQYQGQLIRVAMMYVSTRDVAEEVVQETWLGVLKGLERFEGRSSLKTWMFRILTNIAKTRGVRESRTIPFSALVADEAGGEEFAVDP
ncbi:MAG: sigma-70 family RNA polymerase sigma factor, partial [Dehalococcoidia bacterium]